MSYFKLRLSRLSVAVLIDIDYQFIFSPELGTDFTGFTVYLISMSQSWVDYGSPKTSQWILILIRLCSAAK